MIEITIKTLDSQNHSFSVEDDTTVKQFKEKIFEKLPFPVDSQRLIYCGRVLQDDKNLSEYDVNGKVIHLVQRPPPSASTPSAPTNRAPGSGARPASRERRFGVQGFRSSHNGGNAMYLGAMTIPTDIMDPNSVPQASQSLSQSRLSVARRMIRSAAATLTLLEGGAESGAESGSATPPEEAGTSSESNEDNGSPPPANAAVVQDEDGGRGADSAFIQPTTAAVIASAFSAARSSGVASHMTISRSSPGAEAVSLSVDMDAQGNITHVNGDDFQQAASSSASETPTETSPDETETPAAARRQPAASRRLLRQGYARPATMATLMEELARVNTRLQPFQERFAAMLREDASHAGDEAAAAAANTLFSRVSDVLHSLAHAQHALSDIMCDFAQPAPRALRCRPVLVQHSAVLQAGIPISAQISMLANRGAPGTQPPPAPPTADEATQAPPTAQPGQDGQPPANANGTADAEQPANPGAPRVRILRGGMPQFARVPPALGNLTPGNVEFIMEVGPGSITIDSVEATLMSGNSAVALGSLGSIDASMLGEGGTFPWGSPAPPEFIQNLMQAVAGHMINRSTAGEAPANATTAESANATANAPGQNSQARGNTATHPTTSTQTRSTSRPHVHLASHGIASFGANSFDPFLPCNSHHVVRSSSSSGRRGSRRSEAPRAASSPTPVAQPATAQTVPTPPTAGGVGVGGLPPLAEMMRRLGAQANFIDMASSSAEANFPIVEDIMRTMTQAVASASESNRGATLADMLHSMPDHSYVEGQYLVTDLIMTAARHLTFQDMLALSLGRAETLNPLRPQLRTFLTRRSMQNEPVSTESVRRGAGRLNAELRQYLDILREGRMRPDVDVVQTIDQFNETRLAQMMEMVVLENDDDDSFGRRLVAWFRSYLREMLSILLHCCADGMAGLERILTRYVHLLTSGVPAAIQEWTASSSLGHLRTYMGANAVPPAQIERFLRRPVQVVAPPPPEFADLPVDDGQALPTAPVAVDEPEPMETDAMVVEATPAEMAVAAPAEIPAALVDLVPIPAAGLPVIIPEAWHGSIPSDWVPIISRDSQRQRRQSPQAPFSDAYLSGMPSKRRKVVAAGKPQGSLGQVISDGVRQAVEASGAANAAEAAEASGAAADVQTAYRAQVRSAVAETLGNNPDFAPERFPNAAKYFAKK